MGNIEMLANKMDKLGVLNTTQKEYQEFIIIGFTETWLLRHSGGYSGFKCVSPGFKAIQARRDIRSSGKSKGGGITVLVNNRWCNTGHVTMKEEICSWDIELLTVCLRPNYLPWEFTCVILVVVYILPAATADTVCDVISLVIAWLQTKHPNAFVAMSGDFNQVSLSATLPTFQQCVPCSTRGNKKLHLFYAYVKDAYSSSALPPLGK